MDETRVRFPVKCPTCGTELIGSFAVSDIAGALINDHRIRLYAICHDVSWDASETEVEQIRQYLGAVWLDVHRSAL